MKAISRLAILVSVIFLLGACQEKKITKEINKEEPTKPMSFKEKVMNASFQIENETITLKNGVLGSEDLTNGKSRYKLVSYATGDVNKDKIDDVFAILTHETSGTGLFYHANVLLGNKKNELEFAATDFIGDRIKVEYTEIVKSGTIIGNTDVMHNEADVGTMTAGLIFPGGAVNQGKKVDAHIARTWRFENGKMVQQDQY